MEHILYLLQQYKYVILFPLCVAEGPIIAVITGFVCASRLMNPLIAFPIIVAGDITGDSICYSIGRWGKPALLRRLSNWFGLKAEKRNYVRNIFYANPIKTISASKVVLGIGVAGILLAGHAKVPYPKFIKICLVTSAVQYIIYLSIGVLFGSAYNQINHYLNFFASATLLAGAAIGLFFIIRSIRKKI